MSDSAEHVITLDDSIAESIEVAQQEQAIKARTHELLCVDAETYGYCPEKAREQAALEILGTRRSD